MPYNFPVKEKLHYNWFHIPCSYRLLESSLLFIIVMSTRTQTITVHYGISDLVFTGINIISANTTTNLYDVNVPTTAHLSHDSYIHGT